jgi:hypothetical protein
MKSHSSIHNAADWGHRLRTCIYEPLDLLLVCNVTYYDPNSSDTKGFVQEVLYFNILTATSRHQNDVTGTVFDHPSRHAPTQTTCSSDNYVCALGVKQARRRRM